MSTGICTERIGSGVLPDTRAFPDPAGQLTGTMRVSDSERERAVDVLSKAFAEGRLTATEHDTRIERAYRARTRTELLALSADLPACPLVTLPLLFVLL